MPPPLCSHSFGGGGEGEEEGEGGNRVTHSRCYTLHSPIVSYDLKLLPNFLETDLMFSIK